MYVLTETANSAGLGAAYRAKHSVFMSIDTHISHLIVTSVFIHCAGLMPSGTDFMEAVKHAADYTQAVSPNEHNHYQVGSN